MPRLDQPIRQWRILQFLLANGRATLRRLADAVELDRHERTLRRDLEALSLAGFPIHTDREDGKTYWVLDPEFRQFAVPITASEVFALACAGDLLRPLDATFLGASIRALLRKLDAALPPRQRPYLAELRRRLSAAPVHSVDYGGRTIIIQKLHDAMDRGRTIEMRYESSTPRYRNRPRRADPYRLHYQDGVLYLFAYCHRRRTVRTFAVDRIRSLEVTERPFQLPLYFDLREYLRDAFGIWRGKAEDVALVFKPEAARWAKERTWHSSQRTIPLRGGRIRMQLQVAVTPELVRWVLGFGPQVLVERPASLARAVREAAWRLLGRYERAGTARDAPGRAVAVRIKKAAARKRNGPRMSRLRGRMAVSKHDGDVLS